MFRELSIDEILARREVPFFQNLEIIALLCGISAILLGMLLCAATTLYSRYQSSPVCKQLENIKEELNSNYENNHELKPNTEEETKTKQQELEKKAPKGDLNVVEDPESAIQNSPEHSHTS